MNYPIANDCLRVYFGGHSEPQVGPKLLLQVYVQEPHNIMESPQEECGLKEEIYVENNIIIIDYTVHSILPPQLKTIYEWYKVICGCECCISPKSIHSTLLSWCDCYLNIIKDISQNTQNERSGEIVTCLFETYRNSVIPHGHHIYATTSDIAMAKMCAYPPYLYALPHWKFVLRCFSNFPLIDIPGQGSDRYNSNACS